VELVDRSVLGREDVFVAPDLGVVWVPQPDAALDTLLDLTLVRAEDADDQLDRQVLLAFLVCLEQGIVDSVERPNGSSRAATFNEATIGPLAADADSAGRRRPATVEKTELPVLRHAGSQVTFGTGYFVSRLLFG